jgi:AcrR family transcriptional regulator
MNKSHISRSPKSSGVRSSAQAVPPSPVNMGRRERRAAETRIRLFRCALELIAERGLANVTVEDITEAADVGKGTFFNYFASKDHVLGVMAEIQVGKVKEAAAKAIGGRQSIHTVLRQLVRRLAEEPGRNPRLARAMISSFLASESVREIVKRNMHEGRKTIAEVVETGQERGEIDRRLKRERVAMQLLQALMGTVLLWSLHEKPGLAAWMENTFEHTWRAIAAPGKKRAS